MDKKSDNRLSGNNSVASSPGARGDDRSRRVTEKLFGGQPPSARKNREKPKKPEVIQKRDFDAMSDREKYEVRKAANRKSAAESRKRKARLMERLEATVNELREENTSLRTENNSLRRHLELALAENRRNAGLLQAYATMGSAALPHGGAASAAIPATLSLQLDRRQPPTVPSASILATRQNSSSLQAELIEAELLALRLARGDAYGSLSLR